MAMMKDDRAATSRDAPAATPLPDGRPADLSGVMLGNDFLLQRRLGEGGMGQVYLAEQISLKRRVAVKLLRHELARDAVSRKRFETEAKAVAQLSHPNIVQVYAVGEQDSILYMALEFVDGFTLKEFLTRKGPPDLPIAISIMRQVAAALVRAAEMGIIHRDIKPENLLITRKVEVKVTDFGLSRFMSQAEGMSLTQTGHAMGTPLYMSPEQVMGQPLDVRTDLYSFGATCYHMLTGQPPFMGETAIAVGFKHVQEEPTPVTHFRPDIPPELGTIVSRLMAKKPEDRYQSARELLRDLKRVSEIVHGAAGSAPGLALSGMSGSRVPAPEPTPLPRNERPERATITIRPMPRDAQRRRQAWMPWILGGSLVVAVIGGALVGQWLKASNDAGSPTNPSVPAGPTAPIATPTSTWSAPTFAGEEQRLRAEVEQTRTPLGRPNPGQMVQRGLLSRVQLAQLLLHPHPAFNASPKLDQAEALAKEWSTSSIAAYRLLGQWVHVFVLAARGEIEAACAGALKALNEKSDGPLGKETGEDLTKALLRLPPFNRMMIEALQRMEAKLGGPGKLPARLDELLKLSRTLQTREGRPPRPSKPD